MQSPAQSVATPRAFWRSAAFAFLLGLGSIAALFDTQRQYRDFAPPQVGVSSIDPREFGFLLWYLFWGSLATICFCVALRRTRLPGVLLAACSRLLVRRRATSMLAGALVVMGALFIRHAVMHGQPISDDEMVYAFEAQTLAHGRIKNQPPAAPGFFSNTFIILNERGWYGKYPIGHPLVLAAGELVGARGLVVPLLGLLSVLLTSVIGRRLFGNPAGLLGACLLCVSPQFVWTHATQLSQPTSTVLMLALMWTVLRLHDRGSLRFAALAGLVAGGLILTRPLPGALLVPAACLGRIALQRGTSERSTVPSFAREFAVALPGLLLGIGILLGVNYAQSGSPFMSGYQTVHGAAGRVLWQQGEVSVSLGGALIRQNFWLFGWVCSFAFLPFARARAGAVLFWGTIVAELLYRVLQAKTVVATTGPIYVFELVPLLALGTADGAIRVTSVLERIGVPRAAEWVAASVLACSMVALLGFVPVQGSALLRSSMSRQRVYQMLEHRHADRALVFANSLVAPEREATWAYGAPNPNPDFSDPILFVRRPQGPGGPWLAHEFWRTRFADRRAFIYYDTPTGVIFVELDAERPPGVKALLHELEPLPGTGEATAQEAS